MEEGIELTHEFEAEGRLLTDVGGTLPVKVLSTPGRPRLPDGQATVGFEVCIKHVGAAFEGARCTARARLNEIVDGRKLRFAVEVVAADGRTLGVGTHERRIISTDGSPPAP